MDLATLITWMILAGPVELDEGISVTDLTKAHIPVSVENESLRKTAILRLWVSRDQGKTWKRHSEIQPYNPPPLARTSDSALLNFDFKSDGDGHYWFVCQLEFKDGNLKPPTVNDNSERMLKLYVNSASRPIVRRKVR